MHHLSQLCAGKKKPAHLGYVPIPNLSDYDNKQQFQICHINSYPAWFPFWKENEAIDLYLVFR